MKEQCCICKKYFDLSKLYEYRGSVACGKDFDKAQENADSKRAEIVEDTKFRTERFRGLDMGDSVIGKANREILKADIEIAKKGKLNG
jgi:hypothetical protein